MDIFPTAVEIAGGRMPGDRALDGVSLMPVLRGRREQVRDVMFYYQGTRLLAVRKGRWKAYVAQPAGVTMLGTPQAAGGRPTPGLLYDLHQDPSEQFDVAAAHPDVLADLEREAERHRATVELVPSQLDLPRTGTSNIPGGANTSVRPR
jgi:arylsulfatase A